MSFQWRNTRDFLNNFDLRQYVAASYGVGEGGDGMKVPCPFHNERTASCAIYQDRYHCFGAGCGAHGNSIDFLCKVLNITYGEVLNRDDFGQFTPKESIKPVVEYRQMSNYDIIRNNSNLLRRQEKMNYLYNRHFDKLSIEKSRIGYTTDMNKFTSFEAARYSIPVYNNKNELITARYRIDPIDERQQEPKYLAHPKTPVYLYNSHITTFCSDIVIVGSELDAAFLYYRYNISAVAPPGEGNFKEEWAHLLKNCNVLVWYDYDHAGVMASIKTYNILRYFSNKIRIYQWGNGFKNKEDVCDFVTKYSIEQFMCELDKYDIKAYY